MPVPSSINDLSTNEGDNFPSGTESPTTADNYLRTYAAFIAYVRDRVNLSAGSTAPANPVAYMMWADTANNLLKMRNAANSAWITIGLLGVDNLGLQPAGSIIWHAANTAPAGFIKANGAAISRTTYAALFAAIGTTFGVGNGSTTFNVPDLRGEFPRGWDDGRGIDSGRVFGSLQLDAIQNFSGTFQTAKLNAGETIISTASGAFSRVFNSGVAHPRIAVGVGANLSSDVVTFDTSTSGVRNAAETRARNIALLPCIKY